MAHTAESCPRKMTRSTMAEYFIPLLSTTSSMSPAWADALLAVAPQLPSSSFLGVARMIFTKSPFPKTSDYGH